MISVLGIVYLWFFMNIFLFWLLVYLFWWIVYNGEINIVIGNENWMWVCEVLIKIDIFGLVVDVEKLFLICILGVLDIVCFDEVFELLYLGGCSLVYVVLMMIFEVWECYELMDFVWWVFY